MKYHIVLKFIAIVLCTCLLTVALASAAAVICIGATGLYSNTIEQLQEEQNYWNLRNMASGLAEQYAAVELGGLTQHQVEVFCPLYVPSLLTGNWNYTIEDQAGNLLLSSGTKDQSALEYSYWIDVNYPVILQNSVVGGKTFDPVDTTVPGRVETAEGESVPTAATEYYRTQHVEYTEEDGTTWYSILGICHGPNYLVTIFLTPGAFETDSDWTWQLAQLGYRYRYVAVGVLLASVLLFAAVLTYLCCAAGRAAGTSEVRPGGLNRIPLDLYAGAVCVCGLLALIVGEEVVRWGISEEEFVPALATVAAMGAAVCLLVVGFLFAFASQVKTKGGFWWRRSVIGMVLTLCLGLVKRVLTFCKRILQWLGRFFELLPLTWQWLLTAAAMVFLVLFSITIRSGFALLFSIVLCIAIVIYGAFCFGKLYDGARRMSRGNLGSKVSSGAMAGSFRQFAMELNALADVAVEAARRQMTSERMKAELVTNVSHDIKTPLTSIINYVDLLQKAETEEQRQQYLEVLARQSQRMKKLIEDLVDMSKASSGAMTCELARVDAAEAVKQALGEFSDKLNEAGLIPVVCYPDVPTAMLADGRLTWRVLSNLLSNAVKYAMPGTRLYVDVVRLEGRVLISLKNVSREPLNVAAEELMERFVRGDASRNTEGSGLGLNIARSLMELQRGQLQLLVDGDLFKATMILPEA